MSWFLAAPLAAPIAAPITEDGGKPLLTAGGFPWGFVVIGLLFIATFLLYRSLKRHLGRIPASFEPRETPAGDGRPADPAPPAS